MTVPKLHLKCSSELMRQFRSVASLHSHTLHSEETLSFIKRLGRRFPPLQYAIRRGEEHYTFVHGTKLDFARAWWTPPLTPHAAWRLETGNIERNYGLQALVSLTDHDSIDAPLTLRALSECSNLPVSVEWTIPYKASFFHLGVHNIPIERAILCMAELAGFTQKPDPAQLPDILHALAANRQILIVFNHPCWDEKQIGYDFHVRLALDFIHTCGTWIHALELNGLRPWNENQEVVRMSKATNLPLVSGGDRHALEPNTILDLTKASTFSEFIEQVRSGYTDVLITDQYCEPFTLRILQNLEQILEDRPEHGRGWVRWSDRVFYRCDDGVARPLTVLFANRVPGAVQLFVKAISILRRFSVRSSCRFAFPRQEPAL